MADDVSSYEAQLQQVEAALLSDSNNVELLKLKADLQELIHLTKDLKQTPEEAGSSAAETPGRANYDVTAPVCDLEDIDTPNKNTSGWRVGEKCMAKWKGDGQYYLAVIEIVGDSYMKVKFDGYTTLEIVHVDDLNTVNKNSKHSSSGDEGKPVRGHNKEYLKKKKLKKQERYRKIAEDRETEKNKWLLFNSKANKMPGVTTKSIFASPDNLAGRVGIGTCGIGGRPMTEYTPLEKFKRRGSK